MNRRMKEMLKLRLECQKKLDELCQHPTYTLEYIKAQWARQRECQLNIICTDSMKVLTEKLVHLIDVEEKLHETQYAFLFVLSFLSYNSISNSV